MNKSVRFLVPLGIGLLLYCLPVPEGVTPLAWHLLAIMVATIIGFITNPIPIGAVAFLGLCVAIATNTLKLGEALSGFSNGAIWMILAAFIFSRGFIKTGLGRRIALNVLSSIGDSTLKISYGLALSGLIIAPATPSATARAGGVIYPILRGMCTALDSEPDKNPNRAGRFLVQTYYQTEPILSAMFMTAMAGNPLAVSLAQKTIGIEISWGMWTLAALVPGIVSLICIPLFMYWYCPPEIKYAPEAREVARKERNALGPITRAESLLSVIFIIALLMWCTGSITKINATSVSLFAVGAMLLCDVINWNDFLSETKAWDTFIWMGVLVCMAGFLSSKGLIPWFAKMVSATMVGMDWVTVLSVLAVVFMWSQYAFASLTAHIAGMYAAFLAVAVGAGAPPMLSALLLGFIGNLCYSLTQYTSGPGPIYFGAGYFTIGEWWRIGFVTSVVLFSIWACVGPIWWKVLGLW